MVLIAEGRTYEEMAEKLVVSINTIRSHVKSIYGKLAVNNRTAAIEAARSLKILYIYPRFLLCLHGDAVADLITETTINGHKSHFFQARITSSCDPRRFAFRYDGSITA